MMSSIPCDVGDLEAVRLMKAFNQIDDPKARRLLVAIAEAIARGGTVNVERVEWKDLPKLDA